MQLKEFDVNLIYGISTDFNTIIFGVIKTGCSKN